MSALDRLRLALVYWDPEGPTEEGAKFDAERELDEVERVLRQLPFSVEEVLP